MNDRHQLKSANGSTDEAIIEICHIKHVDWFAGPQTDAADPRTVFEFQSADDMEIVVALLRSGDAEPDRRWMKYAVEREVGTHSFQVTPAE